MAGAEVGLAWPFVEGRAGGERLDGEVKEYQNRRAEEMSVFDLPREDKSCTGQRRPPHEDARRLVAHRSCIHSLRRRNVTHRKTITQL